MKSASPVARLRLLVPTVLCMVVMVCLLALIVAKPSRVRANAPMPSATASHSRARAAAPSRDSIDAAVHRALAAKEIAGCVVVVGTRSRLLVSRAYGLRAVAPAAEPMTTDTIFDLASLTKPIATASSVMLLAERGALGLDMPLEGWFPELAATSKARITPRMLLLHTSGLPAANVLRDYEQGPGELLRAIAALPLAFEPGRGYRYSDTGYVVLGELVRRVAGRDVAEYSRAELFRPMGMSDTRFGPVSSTRVAPTERLGARWLRGEVHDPRASRLGGVAGHAGLFSTGADLARMAQVLLGRSGPFANSTVDRLLHVEGHPSHPRTTAFDLVRVWDSSKNESRLTFAHTGFTGTYLWIDRESDRFLVLLSSRLHPDGKGSVNALRTSLREAALAYPATKVSVGIDVLAENGFEALRGSRVALLTHDAARDARGCRTVDMLHNSREVQVVALFAPEHGLGATGEGAVRDGRDSATGIPVVGLFGQRTEPPDEWANRVDTVVIDLQDAGARFYTYSASMTRCLRWADRHGKRVVVLDRPNPLGGAIAEGPLPDETANEWLHPLPIPIRHGMTMGELATFAARENHLKIEPEVVRMRGWTRDMLFEDTGLDWHAPSPNLRTPHQALLYPGVALVELANVSVGRGTVTPFELVGAPWADHRLEAALRRLAPSGVTIERATFVPSKGPYAGETCRGVRMRVTRPATFSSMKLGYAMVRALVRTYPERFEPSQVNVLLGNRRVFAGVIGGGELPPVEGARCLMCLYE